MKPDRAAGELEAFLAARGEPLLRTATLLAGEAASGEDLLQAALERLLRHWRSIEGSPEGYLRRTMYHLAADGWRRQAARYWEQLTEAEAAQALGCSVGTVKSATSRGLARLRELSESWDDEPHGVKEATSS